MRRAGRRTVDARGVELDELEVLERQAGAGDHGVAVAGARVRARGREPRPAVACPRGRARVRTVQKLARCAWKNLLITRKGEI
jgi:hypothetical protein